MNKLVKGLSVKCLKQAQCLETAMWQFVLHPPGLSRSMSSRSSLYGSLTEDEVTIGDRVIVAGQRKGVVRFSGETDFAPGQYWINK